MKNINLIRAAVGAFVATLALVTGAQATPLTQVSYRLIQATPKSLDVAVLDSAERDAVLHPARFLRWLQTNASETTLISGTVTLRDGHADIHDLKPVVIASPAPNIHIGATQQTTGLLLVVQARPFEGKILMRARVRYTWHVADNDTSVQDHSVKLPVLQTALFTASGLSAPGKPLLETQFDGHKFLVFAVQSGG